MASQADTLALTAAVVDGFSGPLKELVKQLRTFGDYEKVVHKEGSKFAVQHRNAFEDLRKSMKGGAEQIKGALLPAMVGLGLGAVTAAGAIEGISRAIKEFAGTSRDLDQLNRATGLSYDKIRALQELTERLGGSKDEASAGIQKLAASLEQLQKFNTGPLNELGPLIPKGGEGTKFRNELKGAKDEADALAITFRELQKIPEKGGGREKVLGVLGLPPEWAHYTKEQLDDIESHMTHMTKEQVAAGLAGQRAFDRLRESVGYLKEEIGAGLAPTLEDIVNSIREFVHEHGAQMAEIMKRIAAAIRDFDWKGFGQQISDLVGYFGGWANALKLVVGVALVAWLAPAAAAIIGMTASVVGLSAAVGTGLVAAIGRATAASLAFGATPLGMAILAAGGIAALAMPQPLNEGEDEAARQRKYGQHAGPGAPSALSPLGAGAPVEFKKNVKEGVFEGILQAFQQWWSGSGAGGPGGGPGGLGAGGGGGGGGGGGAAADTGPGHGRRSLSGREGAPARGALKANQAEAYKAAIAEGYSPEAAKAIVANLSGESLANPADVHADPSSRNPSQKAHGIASWDDERSRAIKEHFGKSPEQMTVAEQIKAFKWETDTNPRFAKTKAALAGGGSAESMMDPLVRNFESPGNPAGAISNRLGRLRGLGNIEQTGGGEPGTETAAGGEKPKAFIFHHTATHGSVDEVKRILKERHLGVQYIMDKEGNVINTGAGPGAQDIRNESGEYGTALGKKLGLSSKNTVGMEIIADDDSKINKAQIAAAAKFARENYPETPVYGHGEIQRDKEPTEGKTVVDAIRAEREGLHKKTREHESMNHTISGRAGVDIKLAGFPRGTQATAKTEGIFQEVKLTRGRPGYDNRQEA